MSLENLIFISSQYFNIIAHHHRKSHEMTVRCGHGCGGFEKNLVSNPVSCCCLYLESDETLNLTFNILLFIAEQSDICRVCRSEGTPEKPLFYPCVCTGSIKYIHQDWCVSTSFVLSVLLCCCGYCCFWTDCYKDFCSIFVLTMNII